MKVKKVILAVAIAISVICIGGVVTYKNINKAKKVELSVSDDELNISKETLEKSKEMKIENILLLGVDHDENASDAIMILSIDKNDGTAKLTSIMRDTYVYFGEGMANKINYAYNYGGVELTIQKINEIFKLDISKYAKVDFDGFIKIVDTFGGYETEINEQQMNEINYKLGYESLTEYGKVLLNGEQTSAYARIRMADGDYHRTERQRKIMFDIFNKIKDLPFTSYPSTIAQLTSYVDTNLSTIDSIELAKVLVSISSDSIEEFRVPMDGTTRDNCEGVYHLDWDEEVNIDALQEFIYGK